MTTDPNHDYTKVRTSKRWSDRFTPEIKRILGEHLIQEGSMTEDQDHNTDLLMPTARISLRVRRAEYAERYGDGFTIRTGRPTGAQTELDKIRDGWGDYLFYGFSDESGDALDLWTLGDLDVFRSAHVEGKPQTNRDGSAGFRGFRWDQFPSEFVVARSKPKPVISNDDPHVCRPHYPCPACLATIDAAAIKRVDPTGLVFPKQYP